MQSCENDFQNDTKELVSKNDSCEICLSEQISSGSLNGKNQVEVRIAKQLNRVLKNFTREYKPRRTDRESDIRFPTHKNLRVCLLRGHKRMIRNCICKKKPNKQMDLCENQQLYWKEEFENHINNSYNKFKKLSKTKNGPISDGKYQRSQFDEPKTLPKSHNKQYRDDYFSDPDVLNSFELYIEFLFANLEPSSLCKKFEFTCCEDDSHDNFEKCQVKWQELKDILKLNKV